jgi:flagellar basal body-associated protein FliL
MNKKIIIGIIVVIIITVVGIVLYFLLNNKENENNNLNENTANETTQNNSSESNNNNVNSNRKILVVYYSATGSTEKVAKQIADNLDAYLFEIVPKDIYTSDDLDWTDDNSRVSKEHDDESLRNVELTTTKVDNWDTYDTILIGYPIWWGAMRYGNPINA